MCHLCKSRYDKHVSSALRSLLGILGRLAPILLQLQAAVVFFIYL